MEIGQPINSILAIPGVSSQCAYGCQGGKVGVFDVEYFEPVYAHQHKFPISCIYADDEQNIYFSDAKGMFSHDLRNPSEPILINTSDSEINYFAKDGVNIAIATKKNGIILHDERNLNLKLEGKHRSNTATLLHFFDHNTLFAAYSDAALCIWKFDSEEITELEIPQMIQTRRMNPLGVACHERSFAVCYRSGISIYNDRKLICHVDLDQKECFSGIAYAGCFEDPDSFIHDYFVALTEKSTIYPVSFATVKPCQSRSLRGIDISLISANHLMIVVADSSEVGNVAAFMPEDFGEEFF